MNKRVLIAAGIIFLALVGIASAQSGNGNSAANAAQQRKADWQTKQDEMRAQREAALKQKREERCARIQNRIAERLNNFNTIGKKHMAVYTNMQNRIQKFIDRLSAAGVDTAKVKTDLVDLQTKIQKFSADYKNYLTSLGNAKSFKCGDTDAGTTTDVRTAMQAARAALVTVHQDASDIRTFMRTTVVPDILALKKQAATTKATADGSAPKTTEGNGDNTGNNLELE